MSVYSYGPQGPDGQGYHSQGNRRADEPFAAPGGSGPVIDMVPARQRKRHPFLYGLVLVALCGAAAYFGTVYANSRTMPEQQNVVVYQAPSGNAPVTGGARLDAASVAAAASDSVVEITTESVQTGSYFNQYVATGAGSGVIISADGYIVTNDHVISGANSIAVRLHDGTTLDAALVATDAKTDLAVIRVQAQELIPATLGTSADLVVGQPVVAIGNPLGRLGGTVTDGIISAKDRVISIDGEHMTLLQTNAAVNPGNSGGGLFDAQARLVGVGELQILRLGRGGPWLRHSHRHSASRHRAAHHPGLCQRQAVAGHGAGGADILPLCDFRRHRTAGRICEQRRQNGPDERRLPSLHRRACH